jgi:mRNA-degrading endonuclease toxin of MazEF toxin-antitoxin module
MADKLLTVPKSYLGTRIGTVADAELRAVSRATAAFEPSASRTQPWQNHGPC